MSEAAQALAETFGGVWSEHPGFPKEDWQYEVSNGDTVRSYWDWVLSEMEAEAGMKL